MICKANCVLCGVWEWKKDDCLELGKQILTHIIVANYFLEGVVFLCCFLKVIVFGKHHNHISVNDTTKVCF